MSARQTTGWLATAGVGVGVTALLTAVPAISPSDGPLAPLTPQAASAAEQLTPFADCDKLTQWYVDQALADVTAWGLGGSGPEIYAMEDTMMRTAPLAASMAEQRSDVSAVGNAETGTNVQEAGVDEPDVAKLYGDDLVVSIQRNRLVITDVSGVSPQPVSEHTLSTRKWSHELLIVDDTAVVLSTLQDYYAYDDVIVTDRLAWPGAGGSASMVTTVDLSDPTDLETTSRDKYSGSISAAREHDGTIRLVLSSTPQLDFVTPYDRPWHRLWDHRYTRKEARARNREIVRESSAADWLPRHGVDNRGQGGQPLLSCDAVTHPDAGAGLGTISVVTLDPDHPRSPETVGVSAEGSLVYASTDRLYVSTIRGGWDMWWSSGDRNDWRHPLTEVHAFSTEGTETSYVASGTVPGVAPDRWAFSEYDGLLRVATKRDGPGQPDDTGVTVLEEQGSELVKVGGVGGLGEGEEIQAVRWFGDLAVVVTFRQTDPLYTLDLSDPANPQVTGELKITGFSSYLHPVGEDLLLGVGQSATRRGNTTGGQVSTFDLRDLAKPSLVDRLSVGGRHSSSPVADDARAFSYLPEQGLAFVPTESWGRGGTGVDVLSVSASGDLAKSETIEISGYAYGLRSLPLEDGRVVIVHRGEVHSVVDVA